MLLLPPLLLLLCQLAGSSAKSWSDCTAPMPKCKSDRFDVVFSHRRNGWGCKVYECKCKEPQPEQCGSGKAKLRTDSHGCRYYECIVCPPRETCPGSKVSKYKGDDANGCPLYNCQCDQRPSRPACGSGRQLATGTDGSGCLYYYCQQVRSSCPEKPTCSSKQELVALGRVKGCDLYKCECLTPSKPACAIGSQPRLQDDPLGCKSYTCAENRVPCPSAAKCSSPYHIVESDGVDDNNCRKYVCKCLPLTDLSCPIGYKRETDTDPATGCRFHRCEPQCEQRPNCTSVHKRPVVTASRSNGCPKFSCRCVQPEVVNCLEANAHLQLAKASDGSNCDVYECRSGDGDDRCSVPTCRRPLPVGGVDADGCPVYDCADCPPPPSCRGAGCLLLRAGQDAAGCLQYLCYRTVCPRPSVCATSQLAVVTSYRGTCPLYSCLLNTKCPAVPQCPEGMAALQIGHLSNKCPQYICQPSACPAPAVCAMGQQPSWTVDTGACVSVTCSSGSRRCDDPPACGDGESVAVVGASLAGCTRYRCQPTNCPAPTASCSANQEPIVPKYTASGCPVYSCQRLPLGCGQAPNCRQQQYSLNATGHTSTGCPQFACCTKPQACAQRQSLAVVGLDTSGCALHQCHDLRACQVPSCGLGSSLKVAGVDADGCTKYICCSGPPSCTSGQTLTVTGTSSEGCKLYQCKGDRVCAVPSCAVGYAPTEVGTDASTGCTKYTCCAVAPTCTSEETLTVTGKDSSGCKLYQCKTNRVCAVPSCTTGHVVTEVGTDASTGCKKYTCCAVAPTCTSDETLTVTGTNTDGCKLYQCKTNRVCAVPSCASGFAPTEVGTDASTGCTKYTCCAAAPTCTSEETLTVTGKDSSGCKLYQCRANRVCAVPNCTPGSTPTWTGSYESGCKLYTCCRSEPTCRQWEKPVVTGTDADGCKLYQCKGDPVCAVPSCTTGHAATEVGTDASTGCKKYTCCAVAPTCTSDETPTVTGTSSNGCKLYQCKANRVCAVPSCTAGHVVTEVGTDTSTGCTKYTCCAVAPTCTSAETLTVTGSSSDGCKLYQCKANRVCAVPSCTSGFEPTDRGTDASTGCTKYTCCAVAPTCTSAETLTVTGSSSDGCKLYQCKLNRACTVPVCSSQQTLTWLTTGLDGCEQYACCRSKPVCRQGETLTKTGKDSAGCQLYECRSTDRSCQVPSCTAGSLLTVIGKDSSSGCTKFTCCAGPQPCDSGQLLAVVGKDSSGCNSYQCRSQRSCPRPLTCPSGKQQQTIGTDSSGCATFANCDACPHDACPGQKTCEDWQFRVWQIGRVNGGQCCRYSCIGLGDYRGQPPKCDDSPTSCEITQTIETFVDYKRHCQKIECKSEDDEGIMEYLSAMGF